MLFQFGISTGVSLDPENFLRGKGGICTATQAGTWSTFSILQDLQGGFSPHSGKSVVGAGTSAPLTSFQVHLQYLAVWIWLESHRARQRIGRVCKVRNHHKTAEEISDSTASVTWMSAILSRESRDSQGPRGLLTCVIARW